jgi:hypothetical protein
MIRPSTSADVVAQATDKVIVELPHLLIKSNMRVKRITLPHTGQGTSRNNPRFFFSV